MNLYKVKVLQGKGITAVLHKELIVAPDALCLLSHYDKDEVIGITKQESDIKVLK